MELEVGMYIRTKDGKIAKFIKYDEDEFVYTDLLNKMQELQGSDD